MRPARTHGSARRVDLVEQPSQPARRQLIRRTPAEAPGPRHGVDGGRCNGRCTRPAPTPAADVRRSTSGPTPPAEPCPPTAPHRRSHAGPAPVCAAPRSLGGKDRVKRGGELGIPITNQVPQPAEIVAELHEEVPGLLDHPLPHRMRCHREHVDPAGRHLDRKQDVQPPQQDRVHGEAGPPPAHPWPGPAGTAARSAPTAPVPEQPRRAAGWSTRCWPRSGTQGGTARRGCGDIPRSGSLVPAVAPTRGAPRPHADGPADADTSSGAGPGPDASAAAWPAGRSSPARPGEQEPRQPGQHRPVGPVNAWPGHLAA